MSIGVSVYKIAHKYQNKNISRFYYDKAFFGASAVDASFGASATREIEAAVKRCVYANAEESYLLADHTKFGKKIS